MLIRKFNKANLVTYLGLLFGLTSIYFAFNKIAFSDVPSLKLSLIFLVLSGICDMFDGKFARSCKRSKEEKKFGIQIDSLADTVDFLCVPVILLLSLGMNSIICLAVYILFISCGITRLANFNIIAVINKPVKYYSGLPVTATAIIFPILGLLYEKVSNDILSIIYVSTTFIVAILFVLNVKIPKFKGFAYVLVPVAAAVLIALLVMIK